MEMVPIADGTFSVLNDSYLCSLSTYSVVKSTYLLHLVPIPFRIVPILFANATYAVI